MDGVTLAALVEKRNSYATNLHSHVSHAIKQMLSLNSNVTGIAAFVGFDQVVAKLTHVLASEAAHIVGIGVNAHVDTELPRSLADIVGNTYTFQLRRLQFYSKPLPSPASFLQENLHPIQHLLWERAEDPEPAVPQIGAPRTDAIGAVTCTVADRASSSDGPLAGREAAGQEGVTLEKSASKKARVE
ncbi:hypothetical protein Bca4012_037751 [Brassica carinata]